MKQKVNYLAIAVFYIIAIVFRYLATKTELLSGIENECIRTLSRGIGPTIGAITVAYLFKIKPVLSLKGTYKNITLPALVYWCVPIAVITIASYMSKGTFPLIAVLTTLVYALLEEIGWRGFLQQELKSIPEFWSILIISILWYVWHLNFEFQLGNLFFFLILLAGSWGIGKITNKTYSLLAASAFHSLNNFFDELDATKIGILVFLIIIWVVAVILKDRKSVKIAA